MSNKNNIITVHHGNYLYTVQEIASILKLSVLTIYNYIKGHELEAIEFGGHYRIEHTALEKFIENHRVKKSEEDTHEEQS